MVTSKTATFVRYGQLCLSSKQIAGYLDHQYLGKGPIDILDFLHGDSYQGKLAPATTTFGWVWPGVPLG